MTWVLVLTASEDRGLSQADIDAARRTMAEAGDPVRLGPNAVEIPCPARPAVSLPEIDANAVPAANRRKKVLVADMDSTMIPVECIDEVADFAGVKDRVSAITERAMAGELDFVGALRERVALIAGLRESALEEVYAERIRLNPGGKTLVRTMNARGAATALISGGFTFFTQRVAAEAGFAENRANRLDIENGALTGTVAEPILGREAKLAALREIAAREGATLELAMTLGDGANDLAMMEASGLGVGYRPKPAVAERADAVLRHSDLSACLYLQGYHRDEFVSAG